MSTVKVIKKPIDVEYKQFKDFFIKTMHSDNKLLNIVLQYILRNKGKQLRPILVLLTAKLVGEINDKTFVSASMIELMHTATLVHDDVVDNSQIRRGTFSIKALWQSKLSVLVGDFLLSKGLLIAVQYKAYDILEIISFAVKDMAEGELLQIEKSRKLNITEDVYFEIIKKKTASLLVASIVAGAKSVTDDKAKLDNIGKFGLNLGIAFQIKDDLFDYHQTNSIGKPQGNDIQESKMTLPLIFAINKAGIIKSKPVRKILSKKVKSKKDIIFVHNFVVKNGGLDYTQNILNEYLKSSKIILKKYFIDSDVKEALLMLVDYIGFRKK